jgi:hypothetical protein
MRSNIHRCRGVGLFLETSAQIARLLGSQPIRDDVAQLCARFRNVGTSKFVMAEFDEVIGGLMRTVAQALRLLPDRDRERQFDELWKEASDLLPRYYSGQSLAGLFALSMSRRLGPDPICPRYLWNTLEAQIELLRGRFYRVGKLDMAQRKTVFDRTSCCLWEVKRTRACARNDADANCKLHQTCWTQRISFESAVERLTRTQIDEKTVLTRQLPLLALIEDPFEYLMTVTRHPNAFGDILILSEVPEDWSLLTKDRAFSLLCDHQRRNIEVLMVRLPRRKMDVHAEVKREFAGPVGGEIRVENKTSRDLGLTTTTRIGARRTKVTVRVEEEWYDGVVACEEQDASSGTYHYGIRIKPRASSGSQQC